MSSWDIAVAPGRPHWGAPHPAAALSSGGLQSFLTLLPVAGAQLVRLKSVQHAQDFLRIAADVQVGHVDEADDALWVHDVSRALCHTGFGIENAELRCQFALDVGEHRKGQVLQLVLVTAPGQVHELAVDADAEDLGVAGLEFLLELAERGNLGRAYEREERRPEEYDLRLAREAPL